MQVTKTLLDNLDHVGAWGILTTDEELKIVGWNRWLERHSGRSARSVVGRRLFELFPDLLTRGFDGYYQQAINGQAAILSQRFHGYVIPLPPTVADTKLMHMQQTVRISPIMDENEIRGTLTLIEDVTERVLTEQELREQAERLEEANRYKDEFLAMLAHELRNPLAPILNGVRVLDLVPSDSEDGRKARDVIERQVAHMSRLIDDLLDVSRIVRGKVRLHCEPCDLTALLHQVAQDFQPILADNGLSFELELPSDPCWVNGDSVRLSQIVSNLLQNASKFTESGGKVRLAANLPPGEHVMEICVSDTGIGMSPDTLLRIFDAFSQAESSLARSKGGLGLGLALVKGLTELHEGRVDAQSEGIGKGSTFTVRLPIKNADPRESTEPSDQCIGSREINRILIIEDNRDTAMSMEMLLNHLGFQVNVAYSGTDGIDLARVSVPDVVFCDIGLPELDGYEVARTLRNEPATRNAFLIAQSGYGQVDDIRKAKEAGFDLHLLKPVSSSDLERVLKSTK